MLAVLRLDDQGVIVAANAAAEDFLGPCLGRRCCDVVLARGSNRHLVCDVLCAQGAVRGELPSTERRRIKVRDRTVRLICATADDSPTVRIIDDEVEQGETTSLSPREAAALALVAGGCSDDEIADALEVKPSTIKTHLRRARDKLGARNRAQAVALAIRSGCIA